MSLAKPDILQNVGLMPTDPSVNVTTSILEPVVHTDTMCRFVLENKGRLHGNSKITLGLNTPDKKAFFPINVGVHAVINRVCLKFGAKVISEITDFAHWMAYRGCFTPNEHNFERNSITNGTLTSYNIVPADANSFDGNIGIEIGKEYGSGTGAGVTIDSYNNLANNPTYQVRLVDMFPFLGQVQLPLYLMQEQVAIEIYFNTDKGQIVCKPKGDDMPATITIDQSQTKMVADYIYYPQPIMDNYESQMRTSGLTIPYLDYAMVKTSVPIKKVGTNFFLNTENGQFIRNLGGANRLVSKVVVMTTNDQINTNNSLFNQYGSDCGKQFSYNLKYNDRFLYPLAVDNFANAFYQVHNAEGMPLFITGADYQRVTTNFFTNKTFEKYPLNDSTSMQRRTYLAAKLDGQRINAAGIELHLKMAEMVDNGEVSVTCRVYLEQACVLSLKDGKMNKAFA